MAIEVKHYKVRQLPSSPTPNSIYWVKASTDSEVSGYITDLQGVPYPLKDISGSGGIQSIVNSDGNITVTGSDNLVINISPALLSIINSALQSGDNISELFNDAGYITSSSLPTNTSELINDGADGTSTYVEQDDVDLLLQVKQDLPTGFITGLALSIKVGDPTKAIIGTGSYAVSDFSDLNNIQVNIIQVTTPIEFTPQYLNTNPASYIALDINQNVIQSSSPFDNDDRRTLALIGATIHSNLTIINVVNEIKAPIVAPTNQLHDLIRAVGSLNLEGNVYYPNGANLQINKTAGQIWGLGINSQNYLDPHRLTIPAQTGLTFRYRLKDTSLPNGESADTNLIDPEHYDNAGVKTIVPNNRFTIQRINLFQSGLTRIQYGQTVYQNLDEAKILVQTETFETEMNIADNSIFRAYLIIKKGVTDLTTAVANGDAEFIPVDKFGNVIGGAGIVLNFSNITTGLGYVPEDVANKATDFSIINDTLYPSVEAVQEQLDLKLDKSITPSSVYATDGAGAQVMKPLSEFGGGGAKEIRTFYPSWNMANADTWRGWTRNTSNMLVLDATASYGTGTEPTKTATWFADSNVISLNDYNKLNKITFTCRESPVANEIQLYIVVADYSNSRGSEANGQIIVNEVFSLNTTSNLKNNFTIATHSLNANSVMHVFYRRTGSGTNNLQGVQLIYEFE
jgi:hypothetical protein